MKRIFVLIVLSLWILGASMAAASGGESLALGDDAFKKHDYEVALGYYGKALKEAPGNYEASWKMSRAYLDAGSLLDSKDKRGEHFKKSEELARQAVGANPGGAKGHLLLSMAIGKVALDEGPKERVRLSKDVKREVDRALEIDAEDDNAWHVLGRWHRVLASLSWVEKKFADVFLGGVPTEASVQKSAECFRKALELNPDHIHHHLELATTYEALGKRKLAAEAYEKVVSLSVQDPLDRTYKLAAEKRLSKLR